MGFSPLKPHRHTLLSPPRVSSVLWGSHLQYVRCTDTVCGEGNRCTLTSELTSVETYKHTHTHRIRRPPQQIFLYPCKHTTQIHTHTHSSCVWLEKWVTWKFLLANFHGLTSRCFVACLTLLCVVWFISDNVC